MLAPHQLLLIKFFHDYTLDLESKPEKSVSFKKSTLVDADSEQLLTTTEQTDGVLVEQDGDLIVGEKMKRIYSTMLRSFQPKDEVDAQIYEQVFGVHKDIIQEAQKQIRNDTGILSDVQLQRQMVKASDDVRIVIASFDQNKNINFGAGNSSDAYDQAQINYD